MDLEVLNNPSSACLSLPWKSCLVKSSIHISLIGFGGYIYEAHFECQDILMLGKSRIKWRQCPNMTIAVDWDIKHQFKETSSAACLSLWVIYLYNDV